jgi:hypothetical protein
MLVALALAAALLAGDSNAAFPGIPSIYVNYNDDCTFSMNADGGFTFTSTSPPGPTLPPGVYQMIILMPNPPQGYSCSTPDFTLSGPGVNSVTEFPQQATTFDFALPALQASSTYTAYDQNAPAATRVYFTTSATGSSSSLVTTVPDQSSGKGSSQPDLVGSGITQALGTLEAGIDGHGATVSLDGKKVGKLRPGRYKLEAVDPTRRSGLVLRKAGHAWETITTLAFKGTKTVKLTLTAGTWTLGTLPAGGEVSFKVAD